MSFYEAKHYASSVSIKQHTKMDRHLDSQKETFDAVWDYIIEYGIANEDELILVCQINGRRIETLNDVIEVRTTYQDKEG